jgi:hypothetical protein
MAEVTCTLNNLQTEVGPCIVATWGALNTNNQTAAAVKLPGYSDKSVQFVGSNFDSATISLHGSNDGTNFVVLTDPQGNNVAKTAAGLEAVTENTLWIKPVGASIGTNTSVVVTVFAKGVRS